MDDRIAREQQFHDHAYTDDTRAAARKFYSITKRSRVRYRELLRERSPAGARVLEYGCGQGSYAFFLAENGAVVSGIDISPAGIEEARERAEQRGVDADFQVMNAEELKFADDTFDLVCGTAILHHLDLERSFAEVSRVLKASGEAVFIEPMGHNPMINLYRRLTPQMRTADEHPLRVEDFDLARRHFGDVRVDFYHLLGLAAVPFRERRSFPKLLDRLEGVDEWLFRSFDGVRKWAWYAVMVFSEPTRA